MKSLLVRGILLGVLLGVVVVTVGAVRRKGAGGGLYRSLGTFSEVLSLVQDSYVEPVDDRQLFEGAFSGLTGALDPSCEFVPAAKLAEFRRNLDHPGAGVGLVLTRRAGYAGIAAVRAGSPAAKAKLKGGEIIEAIGGKPTRGMALWEADAALRGEAGSRVELAVLRTGTTKRETVTLTREETPFAPPAVTRSGGALIVHPSRIDAKFVEVLEAELATKSAALVLDLRGTGGDDVDPAAAAAARIAGGDLPFAAEEVRRGEARQWKTPSKGARLGAPVAVLVDGGTSGSAEVLAAFLAGKGEATTVGEPTSGFAGKRRLVALPSGGALFLTVVRYRAAGAEKAIDGEGVEPKEFVWTSADGEEGKDPVLERALDLLLGKDARRAAA